MPGIRPRWCNMPITPVTESDVYHGLIYAAQSNRFTHDRMREGESRRDKLIKFRRIRDGIIAELAVERLLNDMFQITTVSAPFKTDWRLPDDMDLVFFTDRQRMVKADVKGLHVWQEGVSPQDILENGFALVPEDQFKRHPKPMYFFTYLFWKNRPSTFSYANEIVEVENDVEVTQIPFESPTSIGISKFSPIRRLTTQIVHTSSNQVAGIQDPSDEFVIDAVFAFSEEVRRKPLSLVSTSGRRFVVWPESWMFSDLRVDLGLNVKDAYVFTAGWARGKEAKEWETLNCGNQAFPVTKTQTDNLYASVNKLHSLRELQDLVKFS